MFCTTLISAPLSSQVHRAHGSPFTAFGSDLVPVSYWGLTSLSPGTPAAVSHLTAGSLLLFRCLSPGDVPRFHCEQLCCHGSLLHNWQMRAMPCCRTPRGPSLQVEQLGSHARILPLLTNPDFWSLDCFLPPAAEAGGITGEAYALFHRCSQRHLGGKKKKNEKGHS